MPEGETVSVHFKGNEEEQELLEWSENLYEDGDFASRSHVHKVALKRMRKEATGEILF